MESNSPIFFYSAGLVAFFFFSSFFSVIKLIFTATDKNNHSATYERLRLYSSKTEKVLNNRLTFSSIVFFGHCLASTGFTVTATVFFRMMYPDTEWYSALGIPLGGSLLALTLGAYFIPRAFARRYWTNLVPFAYYLYTALRWLFVPFVTPMIAFYTFILKITGYDERFAFLSEAEKSRMLQGTTHTDALDEEEQEMIHSIFELGETTVVEVMVPRIDIKAIEVTADLQMALKVIREDGHSRIPVFHNTIDTIVGILYAKDLLSWLSRNTPENWNLASLMKKPHFVPERKKIDDLMREFKKKHLHISVVVDEYGGTAGIITMEDILEEIVGEIQDEYDNEERAITEIEKNSFFVDPLIDLHDLDEELDLGLDLENAEYNTLSGLIYHTFGQVPQVNSTIVHDGIRITILEMDNQRIQKVRIDVLKKTSVLPRESF